MKARVIGCVGLLVVAMLMAGCGSLPSNVPRSFQQLSESDMAFAKGLDDGFMALNVNSSPLGGGVSTYQNSNKAFIAPPLVYLRSFGYDYPDYGYMRMFFLWPLYMDAEGSVYDSDGEMMGHTKASMLRPVYNYFNSVDYEEVFKLTSISFVTLPRLHAHLYSQTRAKHGDESFGKYEILRLPILGPLFSFGPGGKRFLFIPYGYDWDALLKGQVPR